LFSRALLDEMPEKYQDLVREAARECAPGAIIIED
jgi:type III secretory pathway component EscV